MTKLKLRKPRVILTIGNIYQLRHIEKDVTLEVKLIDRVPGRELTFRGHDTDRVLDHDWQFDTRRTFQISVIQALTNGYFELIGPVSDHIEIERH